MIFEGLRVAVTGAGRDTGQAIASAFAQRGAHVYVSARDLDAAAQTADQIRGRGGSADSLRCDLADPASVTDFAAELAQRTGRLDILVNNGARYIEGLELADATDAEIIDTITGAATGTVLLTKHLLALLRNSSRPDIVNLVSTCGEVGHRRSEAHAAFYAAKHAHAGFAEILSYRLRPEGVRVISLFPPDFVQDGPRSAEAELTVHSIIDCLVFAVSQPRDCFIREFRFEQERTAH